MPLEFSLSPYTALHTGCTEECGTPRPRPPVGQPTPNSFYQVRDIGAKENRPDEATWRKGVEDGGRLARCDADVFVRMLVMLAKFYWVL